MLIAISISIPPVSHVPGLLDPMSDPNHDVESRKALSKSAAMTEIKHILDTSRHDLEHDASVASTTSTASSTAPIANFRGSFIRNQIGNVAKCRTIPRDRTSVTQWVHYFTVGWDDVHLWKAAFIEFVGTASLCYTSGLIDTTIGNFETKQVAAYVGVSNIILLSSFIVASAPSSGGHINPLITFSTMLTGLTGFPRGEDKAPECGRARQPHAALEHEENDEQGIKKEQISKDGG